MGDGNRINKTELTRLLRVRPDNSTGNEKVYDTARTLRCCRSKFVVTKAYTSMLYCLTPFTVCRRPPPAALQPGSVSRRPLSRDSPQCNAISQGGASGTYAAHEGMGPRPDPQRTLGTLACGIPVPGSQPRPSIVGLPNFLLIAPRRHEVRTSEGWRVEEAQMMTGKALVRASPGARGTGRGRDLDREVIAASPLLACLLADGQRGMR